jgi:Leu/Phe-tRNA-protein transferase
MDKEIVKEIKEGRWKEKEDQKLTKITYLRIATNWIAQKVIEKCMKTQFATTWTLAIVREVHDKFHQNFQVDL